ncbi:MAG: hypothetical protein D6701_09680, partial [Gemmatimonadetes bacterium]
LPLVAPGFPGVRVGPVSAWDGEGRTLPATTTEGPGGRLDVLVRRGAAARVVVRYAVETGGPRWRAPVLAPRWTAEGAVGAGDPVTVELALPEGVRAGRRFPSGLRGDGAGPLRARLPVVPGLVAWTIDGPAGAADSASAGSASRSPPGPPGFVFWGLFAVYGTIVVLYVVWMRRVERTE